MAKVLRFYKTPGLSPYVESETLQTLAKLSSIRIKALSTESCFYVETQETLTDKEILQIRWVLSPVLNPNQLTDVSRLPLNPEPNCLLIEIGPRSLKIL